MGSSVVRVPPNIAGFLLISLDKQTKEGAPEKKTLPYGSLDFMLPYTPQIGNEWISMPSPAPEVRGAWRTILT